MENPRCWGSWRCWPLPTAASLFFLLPPNLDASLLPHSLPCPLIHSPPLLSPSIPLPFQRLPITCNVNFGGFSPFIIWCFAQVMNLFCLSSLSSNSLALIFPSSHPSPPPRGYWIIVCPRLSPLLHTLSHNGVTFDWFCDHPASIPCLLIAKSVCFGGITFPALCVTLSGMDDKMSLLLLAKGWVYDQVHWIPSQDFA